MNMQHAAAADPSRFGFEIVSTRVLLAPQTVHKKTDHMCGKSFVNQLAALVSFCLLQKHRILMVLGRLNDAKIAHAGLSHAGDGCAAAAEVLEHEGGDRCRCGEIRLQDRATPRIIVSLFFVMHEI